MPGLGNSQAPALGAAIDPWQAVLLDDQPLAAWEESATANGALGFYRDATSHLVVVVPPEAGPTFSAEQLGTAPVPVELKVSSVAKRDIDAVVDKLREIPNLPVASGKSMAFFFNAELERVEVNTSIDAETLANELGDLWSLVDYHATEVVPASRFADTSPFKGAAAIDFENWGDPYYDCSSGFTVVNGSGRRALVTAAHCGPVNTNVRTPDTNSLVGRTEQKNCGPQPNYDNTDLQLIAGQSYSNRIYVGGQTGSAAIVESAGNPAIGNTYNISGAASYEHGNEKVTQLSGQWWASICGSTFWVLNLIVYSRSTSCDLVSGDSGGPIYFKWNTTPPTVSIRGINVAQDLTGPNCYAVKYTTIRDVLGYSVYTG